ncbi:hypothetical protein H5T53_07880 [Candidatus Bipolaricaulota bacterium]|nr:hypothetical protein [Candidatus Bipolaricaulota bacterium]
MVRLALLAVGLVAASGLAQSLSGTWTGDLTLLPSVEVSEATLTLTVTSGRWTLTSATSLDHGVWTDQTFLVHGYALSFRLTVDGKAVFSPVGKVLKHLYRSWAGTRYDQLRWEVPGAHYRYGWVKGEFPFLWGEVTANAYHRANSSSDISSRAFLDVYGWDEGGGWLPLLGQAGVKEEAFIAGKVRIKYWDGQQYRYRTEYNLAVTFDPTSPEPFTLAPAAMAYLDARHGPENWWVDMIYLEEAKVYQWREAYLEYTVTVKPELPHGWGSAKLETVFADLGAGPGFSTAVFTWSRFPLARLAVDWEATWTKEVGLAEVSASIGGIPLCCGVDLALDLDLSTAESAVNVTPSWQGLDGCLSLYGAVGWHDGTLTGGSLYGAKASCALGPGVQGQLVVAFARPPYPRPAWYTGAGFRTVAETGTYEDVRLGVTWKGRGAYGQHSVESGLYWADRTRAPFGFTRLTLSGSFRVLPALTVGVSYQTDDPATPEVDPGLTVSWTFAF